MDEKVLEELGLTKGEARIYLSLLKIGETTTGPIIKNAGISGSKVYEILNKLVEKGLVSYVTREKTKYFQASSPKRLLDYIDKQEKEINQQRKELLDIIPNLETIHKSKQTVQSAQVFEGYGGMTSVFNLILETLKPNEEYYVFSLGQEINKKFELFLLNYHKERIEKKIKLRLIANTREKQIFKELSKFKYSQIRYYENAVPMGVFIFKGHIAIFTIMKKPTFFLIRSDLVYDSYRNFFIDLWNVSQP